MGIDQRDLIAIYIIYCAIPCGPYYHDSSAPLLRDKKGLIILLTNYNDYFFCVYTKKYICVNNNITKS